MKTIALAGAVALLAALPLASANAQLPSGNTGFGDARAQNQPTSRGIPGARWHGGYGYGRSPYVAPYWRRHHRHHRH